MQLFKNFILLLFVLLAGVSFGQQTKVILRDSKTKESIPYAHICLSSSVKEQHFVTNEDGYIEFKIDVATQIAVSSMGFKVFYDTISPGENKTILLTQNIEQLEGIVITGQYTPQRSDKSLYKIKVINSKEISLKGANDLKEILSSELNFKITTDNIMGSSLSLQGVGGENVKILVDGVPIIGRLDGNIDLSQISMANVERIEIVEGPMSVSYGTNALAGVINIITKDKVDGNYDVDISSYYESVGRYNFDGSIAYAKEKNSFILSGGRSFFDGYSQADTSRTDVWNPKVQYFGAVKYKRRINNLNLRLQSDVFYETILNKGNAFKTADIEEGYYYYSAHDMYFNTLRANQKAFLTGTIKDNYIDVSASYSYYNRIREIYSKDLSTEEYTLSTNSGDLDTTKFYAGQFRGVWSKYRRDSILFNYQVGFDINLETGTGAKIQDREQSINDYAIFISAKHHPYKKLLLQGGVRFAYNTEYNPPITPSINIKYDIFDNLMVRSSYSRGFRAPALKQLYLDFNHFVDIRGNANLKAEQSNNFQLNIKYSVKNDNSVFSIEPDLFFNDIDNKIDLLQQTEITIVNSIPDTNVFYIYKNFDNYKTRGYRIKFSYKRGNKLSINLGIANIGSKSVIDKTIIDNTNYVYSPEIGVAAKYFFTDIETNLQLNYKYTGEHERYWVDFDNNLLKNREEDYHMLDISVNRNFLADRFSVVAGVKNAFNVNDINIIGDNGGAYRGYGSSRSVAYGRTYFFRLTYHFNR